MIHTLIGISGYLFLINDSSNELEIHCNNLNLVTSNESIYKYMKYSDKLILIVFPDKSIICNEYLPSNYKAIYRPGIETYKSQLSNIYDMYSIVNNIKYYYKTDTHINIIGSYAVYNEFIKIFNSKFNQNLRPININIIETKCSKDKCICHGDLLNPLNLGDMIRFCCNETRYKIIENQSYILNTILHSEDNIKIFNYELVDITQQFIGQPITWDIISNNIFYYNNPNITFKFRSVIFHDSFLLNLQRLYINTLSETYFIKDSLNIDLINKINPDYIMEFRVERFLR